MPDCVDCIHLRCDSEEHECWCAKEDELTEENEICPLYCVYWAKERNPYQND